MRGGGSSVGIDVGGVMNPRMYTPEAPYSPGPSISRKPGSKAVRWLWFGWLLLTVTMLGPDSTFATEPPRESGKGSVRIVALLPRSRKHE